MVEDKRKVALRGLVVGDRVCVVAAAGAEAF